MREFVHVKVRVPRGFHERLMRVAEARGLARTTLIQLILAEWLHERFPGCLELFSEKDGVYNVVDKLVARIVKVEARGREAYCTLCRSHKCPHAKFVESLALTNNPE